MEPTSVKGELKSGRSSLEELWRQGMSGRGLLTEHTRLMDSFLRATFERCEAARQGFALVALGGYGRQELFPYSDIDLLILYEPGREEQLKEVAETILYPLWDAGLDVGHSVRTVSACLEDADEDFFLQVSLLDARFLSGSPALFVELQAAFQKQYVEGKRQEFLLRMMEHRARRHREFDRHGYLLEPNVKESRGGLRDLHAMLWTAQVVFGLHGLAALEEAGLLHGYERRNCEGALENLVRIRNRLHYASGRKNDRLHFEHQEELARGFGYKESQGLLPVERFMQEVYSNLQTIGVTTDLFFEHVDEVFGVSPRSREDQELEPGIALRHGRIQLTEPGLLEKKPSLLMRLFAQSAKTGVPLHHRARKLVAAHLGLVDDKLRRSKRMGRAFLETLQAAREPLLTLEPLLDTGLLSVYIPEFSTVESLAQHDIYHVYTVDSHLLQTVAELHLLQTEPEHDHLFASLGRPQILFLAALLHDIGKGQGGRHAERGAELAGAVGERIGLDPDEVELLEFLVRNHLFLAATAMRRDLEDETLIQRSAERIGERERATMLYLLSMADARATGPNAWNAWKGALLLELFLKISHRIDAGQSAPDRQQGLLWMREKVTKLIAPGDQALLERLPADYLLGFEPEAVAEHIRLRREIEGGKVLAVPADQGAHWSLLVMTRDRAGLLAKIFGVMALHNLSLLAAGIFTWEDGTVVDVLDVTSAVGEEFAGQDWEKLTLDLQRAVSNQLGLTHRLHRRLKPLGRSGEQLPGRQRPKVVIDNDTSETATVIEVFAQDRPGLLYDISRTLADFGLNISRAKLTKEGGKLIEVFYVNDMEGGKINDPATQEEIRQGLLFAVNSVLELRK